MNTQQPIKIGLFGMDQRSKKIITMTLAQKASRFCEVVDRGAAEIALIDMDSANHQEELNKLRQSPERLPIIAISIKPLNIEGIYFLRKPMSLPGFLQLLNHIFSDRFVQKAAGDGLSLPNGPKENIGIVSADTNHTGAIATILDTRLDKKDNVNSYNESDYLFFDPKQYIIDHIQQAVNKSKTGKKQIFVEFWNDTAVLIDAVNDRICTNISSSRMREFGVVKVKQGSFKVKIRTADHADKINFDPNLSKSVRVTTVDEFIWHLAYITARGRTPNMLGESAFNLEKPVFISEWPNFTRLVPIPHAVRVVAFWIEKPCSLFRLAEIMGVDQEYINGLFYACFCLGIAGQGKRQSDMMIEAYPEEKHKHRSLFSAILGHLKSRNANPRSGD